MAMVSIYQKIKAHSSKTTTRHNRGVVGYLLIAGMMMAGMIAAGGSTIKSLTQVTGNVSTIQQTQIDLQQNRSLLARFTRDYHTDAGQPTDQIIKLVVEPNPWTPDPDVEDGRVPLEGTSYLKYGCGRMPIGKVFDGWGNPYCLIAFHPDDVMTLIADGEYGYHSTQATINGDHTVKADIALWPSFILISAGKDGKFAHADHDAKQHLFNKSGIQQANDFGNTGDDLITFLSFEGLETTSLSTRLEVATGLKNCTSDHQLLSYKYDSVNQKFFWDCVDVDPAVLGVSNAIPVCDTDYQKLVYKGTEGWSCEDVRYKTFVEAAETCNPGETPVKANVGWTCESSGGLTHCVTVFSGSLTDYPTTPASIVHDTRGMPTLLAIDDVANVSRTTNSPVPVVIEGKNNWHVMSCTSQTWEGSGRHLHGAKMMGNHCSLHQASPANRTFYSNNMSLSATLCRL